MPVVFDSFKRIQIYDQSNPSNIYNINADDRRDTLTLAGGTGITLVVNDETDAITVVNTGVPDVANIGLNELLEGQHLINEVPAYYAQNNESWRTIHIGEIQVHDYEEDSVLATKLSTMKFTGHSIESQLNNNLVLKPTGAGVVVADTDTAFQVPVGNSSTRPEDPDLGGKRHIGQIRFNSELVQFEGWDGAGWNTLGGVKSLDGGTTIKPEEDAGSPILNFYASNQVVASFSVLNNKFLSKGLQIPVGTTAGRPDVEELGQIRFNTETVQFEGYNGTGWSSLGGVRDIDGNTYIVPETEPGANENTLYMYTNADLALTVDGDKVVVYNGRELQFRENISGGSQYAGIVAPDNITASYTLKLPTHIGSSGNLLGLGPDGQLEFVNSDSFAGGRVVVSAEYGSDTNDGINKPVRTLKRALQIASGMVYSPSFVYNEDACRRDAGLLIDAMAWDLVTGSNWRTVKASLTYYNATASAVLTSQKTQTINSIKVLKSKILDELDGSSATTVSNLCDVVINILTNGTTVAPAVTMPAMLDSDAENTKAKNILLDNVNFAVAEVIAWIDYQVDNNISPFRSDFDYDEATCQRDTEIILGAVGYDTVLGTNYNAVTTGLAYQRGAVAYLQSSQKTQTIDAIEFLKNSVLSLSAVQSSTTASDRAGAAFDEVINILEAGQLSTDVAADPLVFEPPVGVDVNKVYAKDQLVINREFIRTEIISWINGTYKTLDYDNIKCSRDVGYIIDALCYDILYGGNSATVNAAKAYFSNAVAQLPTTEQKTATSAAFSRLSTVVQQVVVETTVTKSANNEATQDTTGAPATATEATALGLLVQIIIDTIDNDSISGLPSVVYPSLSWVVSELTNAKSAIDANVETFKNDVIVHINTANPFVYNSTKCARDTEYIIKSIAYDLVYGGNSQSIEAGKKYYNGITNNAVIPTETTQTTAALERLKTVLTQVVVNTDVTETVGNLETQVFANPLDVADANAVSVINGLMTNIITILNTNANITVVDPTVTLDAGLAADKAAMLTAKTRIADNVVAFASDYQPNGKKVVINVGSGDYIEDNPVIIPDNVSVLGASLRACDIRPANANRDMFRLRNGAYFGEFTFRDFVDENGIPTHTWDYATVFDDVSDKETSRIGYTNLPISKPIISVSPYIQNVTILSFLGGNGAKVDGALVQTPNVPDVKQLVEYPLTGPVPEQGKSFVANAYTMLSFGGTGWRLVNDAYAQIVSCFQIFLLNGSYCQSGGYLSITNSATNFGLFAMRSSGYSKNAFDFDKGYVTTTGISGSKQTLSVIGFGREPTQDYVIRFRDPSYRVAYDLLMSAKEGIQTDTIDWISDQISGNIAPFSNGFTYDNAVCSRDAGIIVDALGYDLAFGSNFQSVIAGMSYYRAQSADVIGTQKSATLAALNELKARVIDAVSGTPTAVNRASANMDTIINIFNNGLGSVPAFVLPDPTGYDSGYYEARRLLLANKAFLQSEVSAWIDYNFVNFDSHYTSATCQRDVGMIIDAVVYDLVTGSNFASSVAGQAYFRIQSANVTGSQKIQTLSVIEFVKQAAVALVDSSLIAATTAAFDNVYNILDNGLSSVPTYTWPDNGTSTPTTVADAAALQTNRETLVSGVTSYLSTTAPYSTVWAGLSADQKAKCSRDTGYVIDAITYDVQYGGNYQSVIAGNAYYSFGTLEIAAGEKAATIAAYNQLATLMKAYTSGSGDTDVDARIADIVGIINTGTAPSITYPSSAGESSAVQNSKTALQTATNTIKSNVVTHITNTFNGFVYDSVSCERDVGYIIDALRYDMTYGGNIETLVAANAYYNRLTNAFMEPGEKAQALAVQQHLKDIISYIVTGNNSWTKRTSSIQDVSGTPGSAGAGTFLENRFQDIYDTINSDGVAPATITPSLSWVTTKLQNARTTLSSAKATIQSGLISWINEAYPPTAFTYNIAYCQRDVGLIIEAVAADILSGGNSRSVEAGVSQTKVTAIMQDQLAETIAAINYVKGRCQTVLTGIGLSALAGEKFDIITDILSSPSTAPEAYAFSAIGDITSNYKPASTELSFDAATDINISTNVITINSHGLLNGAALIYNNNGNRSITGLDDEQTYYVNFVNGNEFGLYFDESGTVAVDLRALGTGTHKFVKNLQEFYVNEVSETHNTYQELTLAAGSYTFTPGIEITGVTDGGLSSNHAYVYSYDPLTYKLIVSINKVTVGLSSVRNPFSSTSTIDSDHGSATNIDVVEVTAINTLYSATFAVLSTSTGGLLTNLGTLPSKQIWLHRPSVVNSSGHTWEYAGSGIDYNALPQNGGQSIFEYEQVANLPGRVYSSGTNELGDFKVGNFIKAENRTGNVSFTNKVSVAQLDALRLAVGDIVIELISNDIDLGDNEPGGASDNRLSTQKAIRSFMSNRLGSFIDKSVSTNAVPGAVIQLNSSGQINPDLLPAVRTFNSAKTYGYLNRITLLEEVPAYDFLNGDIVTEEYSTVQLTLSAPINAYMGTLVVQATTGAQGYIVSDIYGDSVITVASKVVGTTTGATFNANFDTTNNLTIGGDSTPSTTNTTVRPTIVGTYSSNVNANYVLTNSNEGQYLKLLSSQSYSFTNGAFITSTNDNIQGIVTSTRYGVIGTVDNAGITQGSGYTPLSGSTTYNYVPLTNVSGTGVNAYADITVTNGKVTSVDVRRGGTGYAVANELTASSLNIGGTGTGFKISVTSIEQRLYVSLIGGEKFVATLASPNFIADNNAPVKTITGTSYTAKTFNAQSIAYGGAVDYSSYRITINSHGFSDGDPVKYVSPGTDIGGLTTNEVFYAKAIDLNTIELYNDYKLIDKIEFLTSSTGIHSLTTYAYNLIDNSVYVAAHGWSTGDAVKLVGTDLPIVGGVKIVTGSFFFIGSVTTNSFTLHASRTEALASVNGLVNNRIVFTSTGTGTSTYTKQNVIIQGVVNTSSQNSANWSPLSVTTINASSIVGGVISTSRLASTGVANDTTFLRGDSSWSTAVQSIYESDSPITLTGSFNTLNNKDYYYNAVQIDIDRVDGGSGDALYSNLGVAKFRKSQFSVGTLAAKGEVYIKDGVVDAGTLDQLDSTYFLNPANLTSSVPVNRGGTALSSYATGDMLYASGTTILNKLSIGTANQILTSDGTKPVWSSSVNIPGSLTVQNSVDSTSTSSGTLVVSGGVGIEKNVNVGASMSIGGDLNVAGNVNVAGTITTIKSTTVQVDDKNIELGLVQSFSSLSGTLSGSTISGLGSTAGLTAGMKLVKTTGTGSFGIGPTINTVVNASTITINISSGANTDGTITFDVNGATNSTADGGGITLLGTTNKTFNWVNSSSAWTSSENMNLASGKEYRIAGTKVLDATTLGSGVVTSSLTSVGTIGTGVWQGTIVSPTYGGTGVNNGTRTLTVATNNITLTAATDGSSVTLPADGTLATLANTENLSNKTLITPKIQDGGANNTYNIAVSNLSADRTITLPALSDNDTFIFAAQSQTLSSKTLTTPKINDASENNTYNFAVSELVADRTITLPLLTGNDTFVFEAHTQSLSNKTLVTPKIADSAGNNTYNFVVNDLAADRNITLPLLTTNDTFVFAAHTQTLTNKTLTDSTTYFQDDSDNTRKMQFQLSSISTGTTRTLTVPNQDGTIAVTSDIGNGTLTLGVSGTGLSGSATFTANQSGNATFTVTSNATSANTGGAIVARDANGDFSARYVSSSYVNTSDDVSTGNITYVMAKFGDNYHRSASAAKLAAFLSGQTLNIAGTSANADKLDNLDSTDFSRRQYNTQTNNLAVGWYTIAVNSGDRASARFILKDTASSYHQSVTFYASHFFGSNSDITVVHQSAYSTTPFRYIRIKEGGTYDGALLQVYIDAAASAVQAFVFENEQTSGWVLKDWVADSSNPGGVNNFAALTNVASQVDLDYGGSGNNTLITTGQIYAGGDTTQYVVWNSGNDGSGSGLDADLVDGLDVHTGRNNEANKIVRTDATGYLQVGYINSSSGDEGNNSSPTRVWGTNGTDSYLRTYLTSALSVNYAASAGNADTVDSLHVHAARNNEANKIVRTDATGYIQAGWINTTSGDNGTTAIDRVYASSDGYIRYYTPTNFRTVLNVPTRTGGDASGTWGINVTGSAGSVAASGITGQTGMWTSATRPGPYRLYRRDSDSDYSVQTYWTGSYWRLYGYNGDTAHADTYVGYADSAGSAGSASSASSATYGRYVYDNGTYSGTAAWREASSMYVAYASSAGSASSSSQVTINYNNDSNSTYQMLWGSGNSVYGTAGIYCNPYTDTLYATTFNGTATAAKYADLAENYLADAAYDVGTVLIIGGAQEVTISTATHSPEIAGVVSTNPAHLMNAELKGDHVVAVALQGRVPVKVTGKIKKGDRLVASSKAGYACAMDKSLYEPGCIIGKALADFDGEEGVIEVLVGRV